MASDIKTPTRSVTNLSDGGHIITSKSGQQTYIPKKKVPIGGYILKKRTHKQRVPDFKNLHPGRQALVSLPKPYRKYRDELRRQRGRRDTCIDNERYQYRYFDRDGRVAATPDGLLGIHVLELGGVSLRVTAFDPGAPMFFYCLISVGEKKRMTKVVFSDTPNRVRVDSTMFFNIEISDFRENRRNKVKMEVWAFQEPEVHYIIGQKQIHLYNFIQGIHAIERIHLWSDGLHAASMAFEYAFSYGIFGYGHSNQLKNTETSIFEAVSHSMFPRVRLGDNDLVDNRFNIRIPRTLQVMTLNSFILEAEDGTIPNRRKLGPNYDESIFSPRPFRMHQVEFSHGYPVYCKVNMTIHQKDIQADFNEAFGEVLCITGRKDRVDYFKTLVNGRYEDLRETEVGPLFTEIEETELEKIVQEIEDEPSVIVYPKNNPCTVYPPAMIGQEEEALFDTLKSTTRTSGWLSRLFGYDDLSTDPHAEEGDYPFLYLRGYNKHRLSAWQKCVKGVKFGWSKFTYVIYCIVHFILPDLQTGRELPDIAVTLPSPQGSTTNLYIQWINEETEHACYGNLKHFKNTHLSAFDHTIRDDDGQSGSTNFGSKRIDDGVPDPPSNVPAERENTFFKAAMKPGPSTRLKPQPGPNDPKPDPAGLKFKPKSA